MPQAQERERAAYKIVTEPEGETSEAIIEESKRLGPDATNPEVVESVQERHGIDTSPSWVSRVRNKHLEEVDDPTTEPDTTVAAPDERRRGMTASPFDDVDFPNGIGEAEIRAIVEDTVAQYTDELEPEVVRIHRRVNELHDEIDDLIEFLEADAYPTDLDDYPDEVVRELKAQVLEEKLGELRGSTDTES